jgi:hypothetical protein
MFSKRVSVWFTVVFVVLMVASLLVYWFRIQQNTYADEIISKTTERFDKNISGFLKAVNATKGNLEKGLYKYPVAMSNADSLNLFFSQLIANDKFLTGVILIDSTMNYTIVEDGETWTTTYNNNKEDSLIGWQRLNQKLKVVSEWSDTYSYLISRKSFSHIVNQLGDNDTTNVWVNVDRPFAESAELLMMVFDTKTYLGKEIAVAFLYSTQKMGKQFASALKYKNPLVSVITQNNEILTPVKTADTAKIKHYFELSSEVKKLIDKWKSQKDKLNYSYSFTFKDQVYWTRLMHLQPQMGITGYGLTLSALDLAKTERDQELVFIYLAALFLILAVLSYLTALRKHREKITQTPEPPALLQVEDIPDLIKNGESDSIELKSSLRWDYHEQAVNPILEGVIMKSIAAFANARGGILFIGVADNHEILGLVPDFKTLKKQDVDYFELHLRKLITNQFGLTFSNHFLQIQFPEIEGKVICVIQIHPGVQPLFIVTKSKQGQEVEKFFVRSGNASQEVASLKEMNEYISRRFGGG